MSERTCTVEDCDQRHYGRGLCQRHYKADHYQRNVERYKALMAEWRAANPDRIKALNVAVYERSAETIKARSTAWRMANPELKKANDAAWRAANLERKSALDAAWRAANPDRQRIRHARYYRDNKELYRQCAARRKARKLGNASSGRVDYVEILAEHGMVCHICGGDISSRDDLHFDHVIPLARGGPHSAENIRPSHALCNLRKGARLLAG